ncbi:MAG: ATP-binding cassette domain-containing protein [Luteitalea sp.]|nr:ATP-binding cassette domain-containing protein [Luteitalea sp.]
MTESSLTFESLPHRLTAFARQGIRKRQRCIPFVGQMEIADCGAACLTMVLASFGKEIPLREVRGRIGGGRSGTSGYALLKVARGYGLQGRGVRIEPVDLRHLSPGTILHWGFDHFVVFERTVRRGIVVLDPASGRRVARPDEVERKFTGVALVLQPGETFARESRRVAPLNVYLRRLMTHWRVLGQVLLHSVLLQIFVLALPLLTGTIVDGIVPRSDFELLQVLALGAAGMLTLHWCAALVRSLLLLRVQGLLDTELGVGFMDHLARLPYDFFLRRSAGDLLARFQSNRELRETLTTRAVTTLLDGSLVVLYLIALLWTSIPVGALVGGLGLLHVALFLATRRKVRELTSRSLDVQARASSRLVDIVTGMETLKSMGAEAQAVERWSHLFVDEVNVAIDKGKLQAWTDSLRNTLQVGGPLVILLLGGYLVLADRLSLGTMLALNALAFGFLTPLSQLVATAFQLQELRGHVGRIEDILQEPVEQDERAAQAAPGLSGRIRLEHVDFAYTENEPRVLRGVSIAIETGQKVAIVGPSGAGKSTLARLMIGLYRPTAGRVVYDGHDLSRLDLASLRRQIGVVCQGAHVFGGTIRANIALADPDATPQAVAEAARLAEIHDDIAALPMGYDTILSDGAASLSGGQRQRLAIARALLHQPSILVLDEATSELDTVSERRIMSRLAEMRCTRIVVAHRLSTVVDADLILVVERGRIVESGRHTELLERRGLYAQLAGQEAIARDSDRRRA